MKLTIRRPDDWHVHLRDGEHLATTVPATSRQFGRALVMPNLTPPVTSIALANAYKDRILHAVPEGHTFTPLMSLYLTDHTDPGEIERGAKCDAFIGVKLYPAHATTGSSHGLTDLKKADRCFEVMEKIGLPLLVHGEVTDPAVDIFDREKIFIERDLIPLRKRFPSLKIIFEHITTKQAVDFVREQQGKMAATITVHHLLINRNAMFQGGLRPHAYCLPVAKREEHRLALRKAAVSGETHFFLGTDSAPHTVRAKESDCGCAGIFLAPSALELYAQVFEEEGALDKLENFASVFGAQFYDLPLNKEQITLEKKDWTVPETVKDFKPFFAGQNLHWQCY